MAITTIPDWVVERFGHLPSGSDPDLLGNLWSRGRLRFHGVGQRKTDVIDELTARLSCVALNRHKQLLVVFPDRQPRRPALLFSTCLIVKNRERRQVSQTGGRVLYFGSTVGIRRYLGEISIGNLALASVFPTARTLNSYDNNKSTGQQKTMGSHDIEKLSLPEVNCVYSPADAVSVVHQNAPDWIAIDLSDGTVPSWLSSLLTYTRTRGIPVLAWGQNLLSQGVGEFMRAGCMVFRWPEIPELTTKITPIVLTGTKVDALSADLKKMEMCLVKAARLAEGRLGQDAVNWGWAGLRTLEGLPVPVELYEVESKNFWGLRTMASLERGLERFSKAIYPTSSDLASFLDEASIHIGSAMKQLRTVEPPLWTALTELCVADVPVGRARVMIFPSAARKQIFLFSLLSRLNITEEDLRELRIWILSLKEFYQVAASTELTDSVLDNHQGVLPSNLKLVPLLIGIPSPLVSWRLVSLFRCEEVEVLLYPHQGSVFARRIDLWKKTLAVDLAQEVKIVSHLGRDVPFTSNSSSQFLRLSLQAPSFYEVNKNVMSKARSITPWESKDPLEEVKWLLQADDDSTDDGILSQLSDIKKMNDGIDGASGEIFDDSGWVEQAMFVGLSDGWHGLFPIDDTIQVIVATAEGDSVEERYIRSLRMGDRVLFIHGLRRQSLYDLIVSRVHRIPAIELHLALIKRWQDDFRQAYNRQRDLRRRSLDDLLHALQARGSTLVSSLTLRFWLRAQTLSPDDAEDLRRLGEEFGLNFLRQYYRRIHAAARRVGGIHRGLARKLNHWLRRGAPTTDDDMNEVFDLELGLTFQDFRDSLMILRVEALESKSGPFSRSSLGQLERRGKDERH
jgi:hypothetical protein